VAGHRFSDFKVGDIVVPSVSMQYFYSHWRGSVLEVVKLLPNIRRVEAKILEGPNLASCPHTYNIGDVAKWDYQDLSLVQKYTKKCNCQIETLMLKGCQCGGE
jgi:hypothetical protein